MNLFGVMIHQMVVPSSIGGNSFQILILRGTENNLLLEEGLENAESVVALTNIDEENILLSLYAKTKTDGKIITKINRIAYDEVIDNLNLDTIVYPKNITADTIVSYVRAMNNRRGSNIETVYNLIKGRVEAVEFTIGNDYMIEISPDGKAKFWPLYDLENRKVMVFDELDIHPEKESERKIVDWDRTYLLTNYYTI